ncbi:MAG: DUF5132 domain-containing protein [Hyphomicrobiales bacterium]|nr:DUF5132 domain-containing protein [Hyphomicrobiales bacterium]
MAIGAGVLATALLVLPGAARAARPAVKAALKAGMGAYRRGGEIVAGLGEAAEDLVAEVQEELAEDTWAEEAAAAGTAAPSEPAPGAETEAGPEAGPEPAAEVKPKPKPKTKGRAGTRRAARGDGA